MAGANRNRIIVNASPFETRVALVVNGRLQRIFLESDESRPLVGNIYKGKVNRVLPGMNAAFVDIGLERAGFMHASDLEASTDEELQDSDADGGPRGRQAEPSITELVRNGQELLVQVVKPPKGTKGARLTGQISLPGRNVVLVPQQPMLGVSRKIRNPAERKRLRQLVEAHGRREVGYVVRTVAEGKTDEEILADLDYLGRLWDSVRNKDNRVSSPALIFQDLDIALRTLRDMLTDSVDEVWIDDTTEYERLHKYVEQVIPGRAADVKLFTKPEAIFQGFGIEAQLSSALKKRVDLPSAGYLIVDETEALTTIDVNTGGFVGSTSLEDTVLRTNREAVIEIAHQLQLRNIGGIVVLDFIDMLEKRNREAIYDQFREAVRHDPARVTITKVSELGLVEMTRQRLGLSLSAAMTEGCSCCGGTGRTLRSRSVLGQLYRHVLIQCTQHPNQSIEVQLHPTLADRLWETEMNWLQEFETRFGNRIRLAFDPAMVPDVFRVTAKGSAQ